MFNICPAERQMSGSLIFFVIFGGDDVCKTGLEDVILTGRCAMRV